jgi:DNA-binding CsgD family transcriptional regulator
MRSQTLRAVGDNLGRLSSTLGTSGFERALAEYLGELVPHDMMTVARYSPHAPPQLIAYSAGFPEQMADTYEQTYRLIDPYDAYLRSETPAPVITLGELSTGRRKVDRYIREFMFKNGIRDEVGLFLPPVAGSILGLFYESLERAYGPTEQGFLQSLYPLVANLYRAHLRTLFAAPPADMEASPATHDAMLVANGAGEPVWSSSTWAGLSDAVRAEQTARSATDQGAAASSIQLSDTQTLVSDLISESPRRVIWLVATSPADGSAEDRLAAGIKIFDDLLTPREADVVRLILKGYPTALIAEQLDLSRGTVKNHRRRIYDKLDITTERELFLMYIDAAVGPGDRDA